MRNCEVVIRDRLREIEAELLELVTAARAPTEWEIAAALLAEARRIERNAGGRADQREIR
jgi:hypothetical protein